METMQGFLGAIPHMSNAALLAANWEDVMLEQLHRRINPHGCGNKGCPDCTWRFGKEARR